MYCFCCYEYLQNKKCKIIDNKKDDLWPAYIHLLVYWNDKHANSWLQELARWIEKLEGGLLEKKGINHLKYLHFGVLRLKHLFDEKDEVQYCNKGTYSSLRKIRTDSRSLEQN